jgi:hypothetical protein
LIFETDRNLNCDWICTKAGNDGFKRAFKGSTGTIEFINETNARHAIFISLAPNGFRLRFNAGDTVKHGYGAIKHAQGTFDFHCEIDVARSIDDVDAVFGFVAIPETGRRSAGNRNTALLFLLHPVHGRRTLVHLANFVRDTRVIKDALRGGGLTGIDVGHDADIPELV